MDRRISPGGGEAGTPGKTKASSDGGGTDAKHMVNTAQMVGITFFAVCGGPFGFEEAVKAGGGPMALFAVMVVPFFWSIPLAFMTAELSCMIPDIGGPVIWIDRAFGEFWGLLNALFTCIVNTFDNALYPAMFTDYLGEAVEATLGMQIPLWLRLLLRGGVVALVAVLNVMGADIVGDATATLGAVVLAPFAIMLVMGAPLVLKAWNSPMDYGEDLDANVKYEWGVFFTIILWNTAGFDAAGACAAEVQDPGKTYPRALAISIVLVVLAYAAPVLVGITAIPDSNKWKDGTFVDVGKEIGGVGLADFIGFAGVASSVGMLCTLTCTSARMLAGMAEIGAMPQVLGKLHPKFNTPHIAVVTLCTVTLILTPLPFKRIAEVDMIFYCLSTVLKFLALLRLRKTEPDTDRPYRVPLEGWLLTAHFAPAIFICFSLVSLCSTFALTITVVLSVLCVAAVAVIMFMRMRIRSKNMEAAESPGSSPSKLPEDVWVDVALSEGGSASPPLPVSTPNRPKGKDDGYELLEVGALSAGKLEAQAARRP